MAVQDFAFIADLTQAALTTPQGWLSRVNTFPEIAMAPVAGKIEIPVISSVTVATPVDGTPLTNGYASTSVTLTYVDQVAAYKWAHSRHRAISTTAAHLLKIVEKMRDSLADAMADSLLADMIAATPGNSETLTAGQINFTTDGTNGETLDNLRFVQRAKNYVLDNNQGATVDDITAITDTAGKSNLQVLGTIVPGQSIYDPTPERVAGVPIFAIVGNSTIGGASEPAMYIHHRDALGLAWGVFEVTSDPEMADSDGYHELILQAPYGHAVIRAGGIAEILSNSS